MNPTQKSPESGFALQKYLLLHSQHDALQKHLDHITTSFSTTSATSPSRSPDRHRHASLSSSPGSDDSFLTSPPRVARNHHRGGSIPQSRPRPVMRTRRSSLPPVVDERILGEIEQDEVKLKDVNQQIKSTLTELLNCESVRGDRRYRMWIQTRLMDAEKELKNTRSKSCGRRRSENAEGMML
jgi:LmbE family N-acetylglucosaminyl deacetylase